MSSSDVNIILPEEVWLEIFTYLPLGDRKNIRLTCLRFYEICNCSHLLEFEELVFLGNFNTNAAIESLNISKRKIWNIKLKKAPLMDDSILPFFRNQGTNIRSLVFEYCIIKPLLKNILQSCENLRSFALCFRAGDHAQKKWVSEDNIFHIFDTLRKNGTIRQHVTDFSFTFSDFRTPEYSVLTNRKLNDFFTIFPNIKKLKLSLCGNYNHHEPDFDFSQSSSNATDTEFLLSSIYYQIYKIRHQLEMLNLMYRCYNCDALKRSCPSFGILNKITTIDMKNMKSLSFNYKNLWNNSIMYPILQLEFLTHFQCTIGSQDDKVTDVLQVILNTAPNLNYLKMKISYSTYVIDRNCFQLLVLSKLKWLVILNSIIKINFEHSSVGDSLLPNNSLTNFYVKISSSDDTTLSLFATFFHGLKKLFLEDFQVQIIPTIFKYQTKLQSLTLYV